MNPSDRNAFAGGDQDYLRNVQYADSTKLDVRAALHQRYSTATIAFPDFAASLVDWRPDMTVLECGAGAGRFWTNDRSPRSINLTVTDLSPGMVEAAVANASARGFEHVTGRECDVQALPFADGSVDLVIANHMLYHVPDPDRAVSELARVLGPEGVLLAATNGHGHMDAMTDAVAEVFGASTSAQSKALYDVFGIESGEARLRQHFGAIAWHAYDNDLVVDDPAPAVAYGLSFPPGERADETQAAAFARAIERRFIDGRLRIGTRTGAFVASRPRLRGLVDAQ